MNRRRRRWLLAATIPALALTAAVGVAQRYRIRIEPNAPYDGRFTFVRLRYQVVYRSGWEFDYPAMERNLMSIVTDLTTLKPHVRESNILDMDDPELFKYPIAYLSEPGYWQPSESEAAGLRTWLTKGGFLIVDDFYLGQWENFQQSMRRVLPQARFVRLERSNAIFNSFFSIATLEGMSHPDNASAKAVYLGIYEDNDPEKRLMVIVNYNNDIGDYMEWSGQGWYPVNLSNDAYKFATNYLVYGMTH